MEPLVGVLLMILAVRPRIVGFRAWWLNPDEGIYYAIFTRSTGVWRDIMENTHPPLYYLLLRLVGFATQDFFWFRAFSFVCGIAAVYAVWLAARELAGPGARGTTAGLVAGLLVASSPTAAELSKVIRPYMLLLTLLALSLWLLLRYLRTGSKRTLVWYMTVLCLALLTHYSAMLALGAFLLMTVLVGIERRWAVSEWRRMALAHAAPGGLLLALYLLHMRHLVGSTAVEANLGGWLSGYMVSSPVDAWVGVLGSLTLVAGPGLVGPLALLLVTALVVSAAKRDLRPFVLGLGTLGIGIAAAAIGAYPLGPTRHSIWLMAMVVPVVGWLAGHLVSLPARRMMLVTAAIAMLLLTDDTVGRWLGLSYVPPKAPERVLRTADVSGLRDFLDGERPSLLVMGGQTFHMLVPLFSPAWEEGAFTADSSVFHFRMDGRHVVAGQGWDLRAMEGVGGDTSYLLDVLSSATGDLPKADQAGESTAWVLAGGWAVPVVADLRDLTVSEPLVHAERGGPGLVALLLDVDAYRRAAERARDQGRVAGR